MGRKLWITLFLALPLAIISYFWPIISGEFSGSAHYAEQDKRLYNHFTPEVLKNMPRISGRYQFDFINVAGPGTRNHGMIFDGTTNVQTINAYLLSEGYKKKLACSIDGDCWQGKDPSETIAVASSSELNEVIVSVVYSTRK